MSPIVNTAAPERGPWLTLFAADGGRITEMINSYDVNDSMPRDWSVMPKVQKPSVGFLGLASDDSVIQ